MLVGSFPLSSSNQNYFYFKQETNHEQQLVTTLLDQIIKSPSKSLQMPGLIPLLGLLHSLSTHSLALLSYCVGDWEIWKSIRLAIRFVALLLLLAGIPLAGRGALAKAQVT